MRAPQQTDDLTIQQCVSIERQGIMRDFYLDVEQKMKQREKYEYFRGELYIQAIDHTNRLILYIFVNNTKSAGWIIILETGPMGARNWEMIAPSVYEESINHYVDSAQLLKEGCRIVHTRI